MPKRILVIEDDPALLRMFESMLEEASFEVETARNGKLGLEKIKEYRPDLILLDVLMPVMDGYEVLKNLKTWEDGGKIPVIVLTSLGQEKDEKTARALGASDFLNKDDIHLAGILDKINKLLDKNNPQK